MTDQPPSAPGSSPEADGVHPANETGAAAPTGAAARQVGHAPGSDLGVVGTGPGGGPRPADPEPWELVGEKSVYEGFLTVKVRRYRLPDGHEVDWDVFGPGFATGVTVLPLTPDGRIVTVRMFRAGPDQVVTNLPGGLVDPGEDPAEGGRRELEEETGYTCESIEVVGWLWAGASSVFRKYVAIARGCRPDGQQQLDEAEDCVPVELTVDEFRAELRTPGQMTGTDAAYLALEHASLL